MIRNDLTLDGRRVELDELTMRVALVVGERDAYIPLSSSLPLLDVIPSEETDVFEFPTGHVGTFVDRPMRSGGPASVTGSRLRSDPAERYRHVSNPDSTARSDR